MSDFPSINDLTKARSQKTPAQDPQLHVAAPEVEKKFADKMKQVGLKEREKETERLAGLAGFPYINLEKFPVSHQALRQIAKEDAQRLRVICFLATQDEVRVGAVDPTDQEVQEILHVLEERNHAHGALYIISEQSLSHVLKLYATLPVVKPITKDIEIHAEDLAQVGGDVSNFDSFQELVSSEKVTDLVTFVLGAALKLQSSDVHIEAEESGIVVRFRVDGMLHDAALLPKEQYHKLVSRLKLVSSLKINVTDKPQDGRFTIRLPDGDVDVRVSTIPTVYGESIVMRLLAQNREMLTLDRLGLTGRAFEALEREIKRPNGMIITTGPTGSGKTTTLYAIMQILNQSDVKIITLEDPVEYKMEGVNQSQIDPGHGYTFAKGLRSMLRQDPDIAMVGEIRDLETAEIAIQAALTGHLILSTLHTNDAFGAVPRFLSMGVQPFLLAPALNCVLGQRLVRRLCEECKKQVTPSAEEQAHIDRIVTELPQVEKAERDFTNPVWYGPVGCDSCNGLGYKGQVGLYEVFVVDEAVEKEVLADKVAEYEMRRLGREQQTLTMVQDGVLKAMDGVTSLEEVFRVTE